MIQSIPAANHRKGEFGIIIRAADAKIAPNKKVASTRERGTTAMPVGKE